MFADHKDLGINDLILNICCIYKTIWQKCYFPVTASNKWPPFCPRGETGVTTYKKTSAMNKCIVNQVSCLQPKMPDFFTHIKCIVWINIGKYCLCIRIEALNIYLFRHAIYYCQVSIQGQIYLCCGQVQIICSGLLHWYWSNRVIGNVSGIFNPTWNTFSSDEIQPPWLLLHKTFRVDW